MNVENQVIELAKKRGFLWNSFELYGGAAGFYDYGPLGSTLKRNIENTWRKIYVIEEGFMEIETPTIGIESVFQASGHIGGFSDPMCECKECKEGFRADHLLNDIEEIPDTLSNIELDLLILKNNIKCPECKGELGPAREFNLMFKTNIGPGSGRVGYLRPELAQGMFVNFQRIARFYRDKLPFGATQIGKSYRNEISPRQGIIRLREFTQAEVEIFIDPRDKTHPNIDRFKETILNIHSNEFSGFMKVTDAIEKGLIAHEFLAYHISCVNHFLIKVGIDSKKLRFRQHKKDEMAHYAIDCWDAEIKTERFGWIEVVGIADRTDYDINAHAKMSENDISIYIEYDEPKINRMLIITPDMKQLGPMFKGDAKKVSDALKNLTESELKKEMIAVTIDGKACTIPNFMVKYSIEDVKISGENIVPHVIEPSYGIDRIFYCVLEHAFDEEILISKEEEESRIVLRLKPQIAPIQVAVLPLLTKSELIIPAKEIVEKFHAKGIIVTYDDSGTIGRRYRRNDEIGTPYTITIDYQSLDDGTVTIRDRDSMKQTRIAINNIENTVYDLINGVSEFAISLDGVIKIV